MKSTRKCKWFFLSRYTVATKYLQTVQEHCQGTGNTGNTTMIAQMPPLPYPTANPACVGWCPRKHSQTQIKVIFKNNGKNQFAMHFKHWTSWVSPIYLHVTLLFKIWFVNNCFNLHGIICFPKKFSVAQKNIL